jgi:hypothetical protein
LLVAAAVVGCSDDPAGALDPEGSNAPGAPDGGELEGDAGSGPLPSHPDTSSEQGADTAGDTAGLSPDGAVGQDGGGEGGDLDATTDVSGGGEGDAACTDAPDPGRKALHRLNRAEYGATLRDLVGVEEAVAAVLPADDHSYGFDNIAAVLGTSPLLMEKYAAIAESVVELATWKTVPKLLEEVIQAELVAEGCGVQGAYVVLCTNADIQRTVVVEHAGEYSITTKAAGHQAGPEPARMQVRVDNTVLQTFDVPVLPGFPEEYSVNVELSAGPHTVWVSFINDYWNPSAPDPNDRDRNLLVDWIEVVGPTVLPEPEASPLRAAIYTCEPEAAEDAQTCAKSILTSFARRAWRRPVSDEEASRLAAFLDVASEHGGTVDEGIALGLTATLLSPHFLFRVETDPDPLSLEPHPVTAHELASRLSYFLWSSMPDEELFGLADSGALLDDAVLEQQIGRMLTHERAQALVSNFAGQWLYTRGLTDVFKDSGAYPAYDSALATSMRLETELVFSEIAFSDRSMLDLVNAEFTWIDGALADLYGVDVEAAPGQFVRVEDGLGQRRGVVGHAALLTVTSHPARTSPVRRGKWVLGQLLCSEPEPPPAGVPVLPEEEANAGNIKELLAEHSSNPVCAGCHHTMDPLGFSLEAFDGIGALRALYPNGDPVDSTGVLPDGRVIDGPADLAELLRADPMVERCMVERIFTYALGRGVRPLEDACIIDGIVTSARAQGFSFADIATAIVQSPAFRLRRGEGVQ